MTWTPPRRYITLPMAEDIGARLVRAGLVSREQLTAILGSGPATGGALVMRLVDEGTVSQDALVKLMLADGYGPLQNAQDLGRAAPDLTKRVPAAMARTLLALPVRARGQAVVVAMADPSDRHSVGELERCLGQPVRPTAARVGDLRAALALVYPTPPSAQPPPSSCPPAPRRSPPTEPAPGLEAEAVPLVRPKPFVPAVRRTFHRPAPHPKATPAQAPGSPLKDSLSAPRQRDATPPAPVDRSQCLSTSPSAPPTRHAIALADRSDGRAAGPEPASRSILTASETSWADLPPRSEVPPSPPHPAHLGALLAALRAATGRDEALDLACEAGLVLARATVFLALRGTTLRGWTGRGPGIVPDALRNLWIPSTSPSMFRDVLRSGEPHYGPHGSSAADNLFRAAIGSRGGTIAIHPVSVSDRVVGLLCADDVPLTSTSHLEELVYATGATLRRLILAARR